MRALAERVASPLAGRSEFRINHDQFGAGMDDLRECDPLLHEASSSVTPVSFECPKAEFGNGLKRDESQAPGKEALVLGREPRAGHQWRAEHAGVDHDRRARRTETHEL